MKTKLLLISELKFIKSLYPRNTIDWKTIYSYYDAMRTGAKFPPIKVGILPTGDKIVIDGWHRVKARAKIDKHIEAIVKKMKDEKEAYLEAVKANMSHGKQFSFEEKLKIVATLKDMKFDKATISDVVRISDKVLERHKDRVVLSTITGKPFTTGMTKKLAMEDSKEVSAQRTLKTLEQIAILNEMIYLLENKRFNNINEKIKERLKYLNELLNKYFSGQEKKEAIIHVS